MDVIYTLIPMMLIVGFAAVLVFIWMAKSGHFDDMDGAAHRIFMDDEYPEDLSAKPASKEQVEESAQVESEKSSESPTENKKQ